MKVLDRPPTSTPPTASPSGLDPRVRARRIEVRRAIGRRRFWVLVGVVAPVVILLAGIAALWSPLVGVRHIEVTGTSQLDPAVVREAAGLSTGTPMMKVSASSIKARLGAVPLVASVEVQRNWPGTVRITISERRPAVTARAPDGTWREIDLTGRVLSGRADRPALMMVEGPAPAGAPGTFVPAQAATAVRAAAALPTSLRVVVTKVTWDAQGNAALILGSGTPVRLGATDQVSRQMIALTALLPALGMTPVAEIDLTVPDRPVVSHPSVPPPASTAIHQVANA